MSTTTSIMVLGLLASVEAFVGYDCAQKFTNFTTFSLVNIGDCNLPDPIINQTDLTVSLLQLNEFSSVVTRYCKIDIKRTVQRCGMWSHVAAVQNGEIEYIKEISREECEKMHLHKSFTLYHTVIDGLKINASVNFPTIFAGSIDTDGTCKNAGEYIDPFGHYTDVIVQGYVNIRLEERLETVSLDNDKINLQSGTVCTFSEGSCMDSFFGYAFWNIVPSADCAINRYTRLHTGTAARVVERESERLPLFVLESKEVSFAFKEMGLARVCGVDLIRTEHPKLFIQVDPHKHLFPALDQTNVKNVDIFAYMNSKFIYVEEHIRGQINKLYRDVLLQQCELDRKTIANALSLATVAPDLLAYQLMQGPGYISLLAGEVVHILKCTPVDVEVRETKECFQELPVYQGNKSMFLAPRTHILREYGTRTVCDALIPVMFAFGARWFKMLPAVTTQDSPNVLRPSTKQSWKYEGTIDLANSGIYSVRDIEKLRTYIMFPSERNAVLNQIALGASGKIKVSDNLSMAHMLDEESLKRIAESSWNRIWARFITFGSASAGLITIIIIFRLIKFTLDTIIHGYALHSIYGWSVHILAALWNSLTQLIIHLARSPRGQDEGGEKSQSDPSQTQGAVNGGRPAQQGGAAVQGPSIHLEVPAHLSDSSPYRPIYPLIGEPTAPAAREP